MKTYRIIACVAALALAPVMALAAGPAYHTAVKLQAVGANFNAGTGVTAGYVGGTVDRAPLTDNDGKPLSGAGNVCGRTDAVNTFTNMNSKASASAANVPAGAAGATVSNITNPSIAVATGDLSANGGGPSIVAAAALSDHPADVIAAYCGNPILPSAPPGSIVRDGIAPPIASR